MGKPIHAMMEQGYALQVVSNELILQQLLSASWCILAYGVLWNWQMHPISGQAVGR